MVIVRRMILKTIKYVHVRMQCNVCEIHQWCALRAHGTWISPNSTEHFVWKYQFPFDSIGIMLCVRACVCVTMLCIYIGADNEDDGSDNGNENNDVLFSVTHFTIYKSLRLAWFGCRTITTFYQWHTVHKIFSVTMLS